MNAASIGLDAVIFWLFAAAWIVVGGLLFAGVAPRIVREAMRLVKRVLALLDNSPLELEIAKAQADAARITRALAQVPVLRRRTNAALQVIRSTPLLPPTLGTMIGRVRAEVVAFRRALR